MREDLLELGGMVLLIILTLVIGYDLGVRSCAATTMLQADIDLAFSVFWRLLPLVTVCGLLTWVGSLLYLDFVRRWRAAHQDTMRDPLP